MLTRTGPIRQGLEYQDTYALLRIVDWIEHPKAFAWMKLEAREAGFLDDVIVADAQNQNLRLFQVKYGVHPDTPESEWTLNTLLSSVRPNSEPLFKRWFDSWFDMHMRKGFPSVSGALITNRPASADLRRCLKTSTDGMRHLNLTAFAKRFPRKYRKALKQAGNDRKLLNRFCRSFVFQFDQPDLDGAKDQVRMRLAKFGVTDEGLISLQESVRTWATHRDQPRDEGIIRLDDIKLAARWLSPRGLEQQFPIPMDFVLSNHAMHRDLIKAARSADGGIAVISGGPGSGKSTYLSYLEGILKKSGSICLRHHYFVRLDDPDRYRRLKPEIARESLVHDLLAAAPDSLGEQQFHNPNPRELGRYIRTAAQYFHERKRSLILIVDGLDHVLADRDSRELRDFLEDLLPIPKGLCLILGTRPVPSDQLPLAVREYAPESSWLTMPGFGLEGCKQLLWRHRKELHLTDSGQQLDEMGLAFFKRTEGHPLYSRLCLSILFERATMGYLIPRDIENLTLFTGQIADSYERIWLQLSPEAKQVAILLAVTGLPLDASHIIQCLSLANQSSTAVLTGLNKLKPVLAERDGKEALFHFSFLEYVRQTTEFDALKLHVLGSFKEWLLTSAPRMIQWQNLLSVEFQLGNLQTVVERLSRDWVIQSLCDFRPLDQILDQLELGVHSAMNLENFDRAHPLGMLRQTLSWAADGDDRALDKVSMLAWRTNNESPRSIPSPDDIPSFSSEGLQEIALEAAFKRRRDILNGILQELHRRAGNLRTYDYSDVWWKDASAFCDACATAKFEVGAVAEWVRLFRQNRRSSGLFGAYTRSLALSGQITSIYDLLSLSLLNKEKRRILDAFAEVSVITKERANVRHFQQFSNSATGPWSTLYMALNGKRPSRTRMPNARILVDPDREFLDGAEQKRLQWKFTAIYLASVALALIGETQHVSDWISGLDTFAWTRKAAKLLAEVGMIHGLSLSSGALPLYEVVLDAFGNFEAPTFPDNRKIWSAWKAFRDSSQDIVLATSHLRHWAGAGENQQLSIPLIERMRQSSVLGRAPTQEVLSAAHNPLLERADLETYLNQEEAHWHVTVDSFYERALTYADLSNLAFKHGLPARGRGLLEKASDNVIGYGYHKDLYLHEVLHSIDACHLAGSTRTMEWIHKIASIVQSVLDFTDGDETRHTPAYLAGLLGRTATQSLHAYYVDSTQRGELSLAEDIFSEVVSATSFADVLEQTVASTATDAESLHTIERDGAEGRPGARELLAKLLDIYHRLPSSKEEKRENVVATSDTSTDIELLNTIGPTQIREYVETKSNRFEKQRALAAWLRVWLGKTEKRKAVYELALEWISSVGSENVDKEIYDLLEPYAREFDTRGDESAFEFFCRAYNNSHGWSWFFEEFAEIEKRWHRLQATYPGRWREFVRKTCIADESGFPVNRMAALPVPRGVEFLARYASLVDAENLTNAAVSTLIEMMADVQLPDAAWTQATVTPWDVLYSRLTWPSPVVRERAASAFCDLLLNQHTSTGALDYLCARLTSAKLESLTTVILLPIVKAARTNPGVVLNVVGRVESAIARPSALSDRLLREIDAATGTRIP